MISNITNALPNLLKRMKDHEQNIDRNDLRFNLIDNLNFYDSILPRDKTSGGLRHIFLDFNFQLKEKYSSLLTTFQITLDTLPFLKEFEYSVNEVENTLTIRSNCEELSIFSLIMIGALKNLPSDVKNKSIFISLAMHYLSFCINAGYKACKLEDIELLEKYNDGFDKEVFDKIEIFATSERFIGTIHFVGIEMNKDILKIFETYKNVKFTYNEENASFIISMRSTDWDDFWKNAPKYLKDEFTIESSENKVNIL